MSWYSIEHIGNRLTLIGRKCGYVYECLHALIARGSDHGACVGVSDQHDLPRHAFQGLFERRNVGIERCQG